MGDPRKLRKKFKRPLVPFEKARIDSELKYVGEYGLRNKRELWKARYQLSNFRKMARDLKTMPEHQQQIAFGELTTRLRSLGLVSTEATTDDVLSLSVENILDRRLQTVVYKKGLARSIYQARQLVAHKHISIRGRVINSPSYLVKSDEEDHLTFHNHSPYSGRSEKIFGAKPVLKTDTPRESTHAPRKRTSRKSTSNRTTRRTPIKESAKKPTKEVAEKPTKEVAEKPTKEVAEKPTKEVAKKPTKKSAKKPTKEEAEKPTKESAKKLTKEVAEKPTKESAKKPTKKSAKKPTKEEAEKPTKESAKKLTKEVAEKPTKKSAKKPTKEVAEKPTKKSAEKPTKEVAEKITKKSTKKPTKKSRKRTTRKSTKKTETKEE